MRGRGDSPVAFNAVTETKPHSAAEVAETERLHRGGLFRGSNTSRCNPLIIKQLWQNTRNNKRKFAYQDS